VIQDNGDLRLQTEASETLPSASLNCLPGNIREKPYICYSAHIQPKASCRLTFSCLPKEESLSCLKRRGSISFASYVFSRCQFIETYPIRLGNHKLLRICSPVYDFWTRMWLKRHEPKSQRYCGTAQRSGLTHTVSAESWAACH